MVLAHLEPLFNTFGFTVFSRGYEGCSLESKRCRLVPWLQPAVFISLNKIKPHLLKRDTRDSTLKELFLGYVTLLEAEYLHPTE